MSPKDQQGATSMYWKVKRNNPVYKQSDIPVLVGKFNKHFPDKAYLDYVVWYAKEFYDIDPRRLSSDKYANMILEALESLDQADWSFKQLTENMKKEGEI